MTQLMMTLNYGVPVREEQKRVFLVVRSVPIFRIPVQP